MIRLYLIAVVLFLVAAVPSTFAQTSTPATTSPETTVTAPEPTPSLLPPLSDTARERVRHLAANMSNRLEAIRDRFENIEARVESRIEKSKAAGLDTTVAAAKAQEAKDALRDFSTEFSSIDSLVNEFVTANDPRQSWGEVRAVYQESRDDLLAAHSALLAAVNALINPATIPVIPQETEDSESETVNQAVE